MAIAEPNWTQDLSMLEAGQSGTEKSRGDPYIAAENETPRSIARWAPLSLRWQRG